VQSAGKHVAPLVHSRLMPLSPLLLLLNVVYLVNASVIVFNFIIPNLEHTIYRIRMRTR